MTEMNSFLFPCVVFYAVFLTFILCYLLFDSFNQKKITEEKNFTPSDIWENISTCSICLDKFCEKNKPLLLNCAHTYCAQCLSQLLGKTNKTIECPMCREKTRLPLKGLSVNYHLKSIIDLNSQQKNDNLNFQDLVSCDALRRQHEPQRMEKFQFWINNFLIRFR